MNLNTWLPPEPRDARPDERWAVSRELLHRTAVQLAVYLDAAKHPSATGCLPYFRSELTLPESHTDLAAWTKSIGVYLFNADRTGWSDTWLAARAACLDAAPCAGLDEVPLTRWSTVHETLTRWHQLAAEVTRYVNDGLWNRLQSDIYAQFNTLMTAIDDADQGVDHNY